MRLFRTNQKHLLFAAAFLLALVIRAAGAGRGISTDSEAALALQALDISRGQDILLLPHPAYLALTAPLMYLFSGLNWVAHFWPLVAGSLLVLIPLLYQRWLGPLPAVILAFLFALDPGQVAVSLQVGSTPLAVLFVLLALGFWINGLAAWAGIFAGLALLGGPSIWPGLLAIGLALLLIGRIVETPEKDSEGNVVVSETTLSVRTAKLRTALFFGLGAFFFIGTLFLTIPTGLSAAAASLVASLRGWLEPSGIPVSRMLLAYLFYAFLPLPFGLYGAVLGWRRGQWIEQFMLAWFMIALLLVLAYPARQVSDLIWSLIPLSALAARQISRLVQVPAYDRLATLGQAVLVVLILAFMSMTFAAVANRVVPATSQEHLFRLIGAGVMLIASTILIAWGWSTQVALRGFAWGAALILFVYTLSATWNAAGYTEREMGDLWSGPTRLPQEDLMLQTIDLMQQWNGLVEDPELVVVGVESPVLRWALRDVRGVQYATYLPGESNPPMVITAGSPEVSLSATYRGQGFTLAESTDWNSLTALDWGRWLVSRSSSGLGPVREQVILWVRTDVFPGGEDAEQPVEPGAIDDFSNEESPR